MPIAINFKICDNAKDCSGAAVCRVGGIVWKEKKKTLEIHNEKCINCGQCEKACMVHAIRVAKTPKEYRQIKEEINNDPRKQSDLFIDRYGAGPINPAFTTKQRDFGLEIEQYSRLVAVEFYQDDTIECLLKSIPIRELFIGMALRFRKMKVTDNTILREYGIKKLPALLIFNNSKLLGKIEGYYPEERKEDLSEKVSKLIN